MRDHTSGSRQGGRRAVGVRELKTHAAGILRHVRESRASYVLTHRGRAIGMILPLEPGEEPPSAPEGVGDAWDEFLQAGRRLERRFQAGGVRLLSEMRR